ncbi:MAG TPA: M56 family metallopeptidase [Longimicrobium sp.]|jgi:beta-lactamase regulating signal transducer with metallopeptidase domain
MSPALAFLLGATARASLVVAAAGLAAVMLRRASAAVRHGVWAAALLSLLLLPALSLVLPAYRPPAAVVERLAGLRPRAAAGPVADAVRPGGARRTDDPAIFGGEDGPMPSRPPVDPGTVVVAAWIAGFLLVAGRALRSRLAARGLVARARPVSEWTAVLPRGVRLLESGEVAAPAVAGIFRPAVLLPPGAAAWPEEHRRAVLAHELAHVERRDVLTDLLAQAACALHWFNPLAWIAARRLAAERERACDDRVLAAGVEPLGYATVLLEAARASLAARAAAAGTLAMARPSELESRFTALLDPRRRRGPLSRRARAALACCAALFLLPLAAFRAEPAPSPAREPWTGPAATAAAPTARRAPAARRETTSAAVQHADADQPLVITDQDSLLDPESERVALPYERLAARAAAVPAAGPDARAIAALQAELDRVSRGPGDLVRERAIWALTQVRGGRLVEPLLEKLGDADWKVRAYAAWGLAVAGDRRATAPLIPLLRDPVWRVRAMAAAALVDLGDPAARDAMVAVIADPAWQVRISVVHYLERSGSPDALAQLRPLLSDPHAGTRLTAEAAAARLSGRR